MSGEGAVKLAGKASDVAATSSQMHTMVDIAKQWKARRHFHSWRKAVCTLDSVLDRVEVGQASD